MKIETKIWFCLGIAEIISLVLANIFTWKNYPYNIIFPFGVIIFYYFFGILLAYKLTFGGILK